MSVVITPNLNVWVFLNNSESLQYTPNKMLPKKQYSIKIEREQKQLKELKLKLNQQLRINNNTQQNFNSSIRNHRLPTITQQKLKPKTDRYLSESLRYQNNLRTIIVQIKQKMNSPPHEQLKAYKMRTTLRQPQLQTLPVKDNFNFKVSPANLFPDRYRTTNLSKSYIQANDRKYSPVKLRKGTVTRYQRFDFEPWNTNEQQQITIHNN